MIRLLVIISIDGWSRFSVLKVVIVSATLNKGVKTLNTGN